MFSIDPIADILIYYPSEGSAFFSFILFGDFFGPLLTTIGTTPLMASLNILPEVYSPLNHAYLLHLSLIAQAAVIAGAAQNILSKSSKYSLFDPCKVNCIMVATVVLTSLTLTCLALLLFFIFDPLNTPALLIRIRTYYFFRRWLSRH